MQIKEMIAGSLAVVWRLSRAYSPIGRSELGVWKLEDEEALLIEGRVKSFRRFMLNWFLKVYFSSWDSVKLLCSGFDHEKLHV